MTKRDFFILLIKVFGLYSVVISLFSVLPGNISLALMDIDAIMIIWVTVAFTVVIGLFVFLQSQNKTIGLVLIHGYIYS